MYLIPVRLSIVPAEWFLQPSWYPDLLFENPLPTLSAHTESIPQDIAGRDIMKLKVSQHHRAGKG